MVNSDPYNSLWTKIPIWTGWYNPLYTANNTCFNHCKNSTWKNSSEVSWVALKAGRALRRSVSHGFFSAFWRLKEPEYSWIRDVVKYVFFLNLVDIFLQQKETQPENNKETLCEGPGVFIFFLFCPSLFPDSIDAVLTIWGRKNCQPTPFTSQTTHRRWPTLQCWGISVNHHHLEMKEHCI